MIGYALFLGIAILDPVTQQTRRPEPPREIYRVWMHSVEEDTAKEEVYRPVGHAFPPARGRRGFEIKEKGDFIAHEIAIGDGVEKVDGKWACEEANVIAVTFPAAKPNDSPDDRPLPPPGPRTLRVLSCDKQVLKLKKPASNQVGR